jgi:hypothetical protein
MRVIAVLLPIFVAGAAAAQTSPFVGHWDGTQHCSTGERSVSLDIVQTADGFITPTMKAGGVGTISDGRVVGDTITMNWSNFLSHVTFKGRFVSPARVEGTYHESITGEDCTWEATNASPQAQALAVVMLPAAAPAAPAPQGAPSSAAPMREAAISPQAAPRVPTELERWKAEAEADRAKLSAHQGAEAKASAVAQFCAYAPEQAACAARIGEAYEFLMHNAYATLTIASRNKVVSLPEMQPAAGMPSYYDVYQVFAFLTRSERR